MLLTHQPPRGRSAIERLLAEQRLSLDEMLHLRATLDQQPGGLMQTHPLPTLSASTERQAHAPIQRTSSTAS